MEIKRRKTNIVNIGTVSIGGDNPIAIQSMTNVDSHDLDALIKQGRELSDAGCEILRVAVPDEDALPTLEAFIKKIDVPIVADIHFDYRLAIGAIKAGADKIRINPGNIGSRERVEAVVKEAKSAGIPIRVGVNSGSLEKDILSKNGGVTAEGLAESALLNLKMIEDMGYDNLVVSIKSSNVDMNYRAHLILADKTEHPIHVGITEAGTAKRGKTKSAIGIGSLLLMGIGDTIRVSLTGDPVNEIAYAKEILETLDIRTPKYDIVSCPTCGRTEIDLETLVDSVEARLSKESFDRPLKIAVMGCAVNGPGEAREADYGIAGGKEKGVIIAGGEIIKTVAENELLDQFIELIRERETING